jgi:hypothetical protein
MSHLLASEQIEDVQQFRALLDRLDYTSSFRIVENEQNYGGLIENFRAALTLNEPSNVEQDRTSSRGMKKDATTQTRRSSDEKARQQQAKPVSLEKQQKDVVVESPTTKHRTKSRTKGRFTKESMEKGKSIISEAEESEKTQSNKPESPLSPDYTTQQTSVDSPAGETSPKVVKKKGELVYSFFYLKCV